MFIKLKNMPQVLIGIVLAAQLGGCIFVDRDHERWHHDHDDHATIDVNVH